MPNPFQDAPAEVTRIITRYGGRNQYDQPLWRVCLAQSVYVTRGGIFHQMPSGELKQFERRPDGTMEYHELKPDAIKIGVFEVPRYNTQGWILERWMPPRIWGSREWWEAQRGGDEEHMGVFPLLGPYPERGDYWLVNGPFDRLPETSDIEQAIGMYEEQQRNRPVNLELEMRRQLREEEDAAVRKYEELVKNLELLQKDVDRVLKSTSLDAQHVRNDNQQLIGSRSHQGVI